MKHIIYYILFVVIYLTSSCSSNKFVYQAAYDGLYGKVDSVWIEKSQLDEESRFEESGVVEHVMKIFNRKGQITQLQNRRTVIDYLVNYAYTYNETPFPQIEMTSYQNGILELHYNSFLVENTKSKIVAVIRDMTDNGKLKQVQTIGFTPNNRSCLLRVENVENSAFDSKTESLRDKKGLDLGTISYNIATDEIDYKIAQRYKKNRLSDVSNYRRVDNGKLEEYMSTKYEYLKFDKKGNWTERKVAEDYLDNPSSASYSIERQTIFYRK